MVGWKERGYVPDSDDEDEIPVDEIGQNPGQESQIDIEFGNSGAPSQPRPSPLTTSNHEVDSHLPVVQPLATDLSDQEDDIPDFEDFDNEDTALQYQPSPEPATSTAARLQAELNRGIKLTQDVLGSVSDLDDATDSPLSSPPASLPDSYHASHDDVPVLTASLVATEPGSLDASGGVQDLSSVTPLSRSLRTRAPIQLHPYALEDAKYRQSLKDRGLKPVRTLSTLQGPDNNAQDESQGREAYQSSQAEDSYDQLPSSSLVRQDPDDESQSPVRGTRTQLPALDLGEDLPELDDILQNHAIPPPGAVTVARKRLQRTRKAGSKHRRDQYHVYDLPDDESEIEPVKRLSRARFRIPPSPPRSRDELSSQDGFPIEPERQLYHDGTPFSLPTPLVSSASHPQKRLRSASAASRIPISLGDTDDSPGSASERSDTEPEGIQRMQRRIKGVLPASWLKLDQKKQLNVDHQRHKLPRSPVKSVVEKGVAKRVPSSAARNRIGNSTQTAFDDRNFYGSSESDTDEAGELGNHGAGEEGFGTLMEDVVEDNAVDAMLPARTRNVSQRRKQQKLGDMWTSTHGKPRKIGAWSGTHDEGSNPRQARTKTSGVSRIHKKMKRVHAQPQITVHDAPGFEEREIPRFLRIAARRKKKSDHPGEQNLTTKFFKLATKRDTTDVKAGLVEWKSRRGRRHSTLPPSIEPHQRASTAQPRPKEDDDVTARDQNNNNNKDTYLTLLKQSTKSTLKRVQLNQTQSNLLDHRSVSQPKRASHFLSDYFKPSSASVRRSSVGRSLDIFKRSLTQSEARAKPPKAHPLPRRVPKKTSGVPNNFQQNQDSNARPSSSVTPSQQHRVHRSRKRRPMALAEQQHLLDDPDEPDTSTNTMNAAEDIEFSRSHASYLAHFPQHEIVTHLMDHPLGRRPLNTEDCLRSSRLWNSGIIKKTIESMKDLSRLLEPKNSTVSIIRPKCGQAIDLGQWSSDIQDVMSELGSAMISLISFDPTRIDLTTPKPTAVSTPSTFVDERQDTSTTTEQTCKTAQEWSQLMNDCQTSLEGLINCVNSTLWFFSGIEIDEFVHFGVSMIEQVTHEISHRRYARTGVSASRMLDLLNKLIILSYQTTKVAEFNDCYGSLVEQSVATHQNLTHLAWSIALREDHAGDLFSYLASFTEASSTARISPDPEMETVLVVRQFSTGDFWDIYLKKFLVQRFEDPDAHPAETLAYTILILGCVYYLYGPDQEDYKLDKETSNSVTSSGLVALQTVLPAFLTCYLDIKQKYQSEPQRTKAGNLINMNQIFDLSQFGTLTFEWCFLLASHFSRNNIDQLLKKIFKCYGDSKMHDFFSSVATHAMPDFLVKRVPYSKLTLDPLDTDFHIFLKLVASSLSIRNQTYEVEYSARQKKLASRKQSLVFSLLPNNAFQVNDDENLTLRDLAAVANRYNLFSTLYHYSPAGYKPPLANIEALIDFGKSHTAVCNLALQCWASIGKSALSQEENPTSLIGLGRWIQDMLTQVAKKLSSIPDDEEDASYLEKQVSEANRRSTNDLLCTIAEIWNNVIELCTTETQARHILNGDRHQGILAILHLCFDHMGLPENVVLKILNLVCSYLKKASEEENAETLEQDLQRILQKLIIRQNNRLWSPNDDLLIALMDTWYQLAKTMVKHKVSSWETYVNPASKLSLDVMLDFPIAGHCITLFLSKALMHKECFDTAPYQYFEHWIGSILLPQKYFKFQHLLMNRFVESAPETLDLAEAVERLYRDMSPGVPVDSQVLFKHRLEIILHIVHSIHKLHNANETSTVGVLSKPQALQLLYSIQKFLKCNWNDHVELRDEWAVFINAVVFEMDLYHVEGLEIDESLITPEIRRYEVKAVQLRRLFIKAFAPRSIKTEDAIDDFKACVQGFRETCEVACFTKDFSPLLTHTATTFNAMEEQYIDDKGRYLLDIKAQLQFLKAVLPEYISRAFDDTQPTMLYASIVLEIAILVMAPVELRFDFDDMASMESLAELAAMLLGAACRCLKGRARRFAHTADWKKLIIARVIELVARGATVWGTLQGKYPSSAAISALQAPVQTCVCFVYEYAEMVFTLPWAPIDQAYTYDLRVYGKRDTLDFGFLLPATDLAADEELKTLRAVVEGDLVVATAAFGERSLAIPWRGPGWAYNCPGVGRGDAFAATAASPEDERELVNAGLSHLQEAMVLLGLKEEEAWGAWVDVDSDDD